MLCHLGTNEAIDICHCVVINVNKQAGIVTFRYREFTGLAGGELDKLMRVLQEVVDNYAIMVLGYRFSLNTCARIDPNHHAIIRYINLEVFKKIISQTTISAPSPFIQVC